MKAGFTGSQRGMTDFQKREFAMLLKLKEVTEFCHGDCIGSDAEANEIAFDTGIRIFTIFPPELSGKRAFCFNSARERNIQLAWREVSYKNEIVQVRWMPEAPYLERNRHIADNVEWMFATPKEYTHTLRSGTWATIRYCWKVHKNSLTIIPPVVRTEEANV